MANVINIADDSQFQPKVAAAQEKTVVVDFTAKWCGPCQRIAPVFAELATTYANAVFLKVDVDVCKETTEQFRVTSMPTFIFLKNGVKIDEMKGADPVGLAQKVKAHCGEAAKKGEEDEGSGVPGYLELNFLIDKQKTECLNESDDHGLECCLRKDPTYLESDCDEQLIIAMSFQQNVKLHSLKLTGPETNGPKVIKIFTNLPNTLDFSDAEKGQPVQEFTLTKEQLAGEIIPMRFVKFQNVQNVNVFVQNNQEDEETTRIDYITFIGIQVSTTNMSDFKRVAGKKGESH